MIYELNEMSPEQRYELSVLLVRSHILYNKHKWYRSVTDHILTLTNGKYSEAVAWWVANMSRAVKRRANGFVFARRRDVYSKHPQGLGYRSVDTLLNLLSDEGCVDLYNGYVETFIKRGGKLYPDKKHPSFCVLTEKGLTLWEGRNLNIDLWKKQEHNEAVLIRDRKTKEVLPTNGHNGVAEMRFSVNQYNKELAGADIKYEGKQIADVIYRRIFTEDLQHGGRLYVAGGGVQVHPEDIRAEKLTIDGEKVAHLDYKAVHPSICYTLLKQKDGFDINFASGCVFDPYDADLSFVYVDQDRKKAWETKYKKKSNPLRKLAKLAILIGMNARDKNDAAWTLGSKVRQDRDKPEKEQDFYALTEDINFAAVFEAVKFHNEPIDDKFFSDSGLWLQRIDSDIMMNIIGALSEKKITCLCYHDSVLVKKSEKDVLMQVMRDAWVTVLGDDTFCVIEEK